MKKFTIKFIELQTVTVEDMEDEIENVVAYTFGTTMGNSREEVIQAFYNNTCDWEWSDADEYPDNICVVDVIDTYDRAILSVTEIVK